MYPHVRNILVGYVVRKPFMTRFMNYDEVEFQSPPCAAQIIPPVTVPETIPVCNRTLVFHAKIWRLHKLVSIFVKRVWPEPVLERLQHHRSLLKLLFRFFKIVLQYIVITIKITFFTF